MKDINYINLYNNFIAQARMAIAEEIRQNQQLTFKTITSITALCVAVVLKDSSNSKNSVSEKKLREVILTNLFPNFKDRKQLNTSEGRPIYNKIRAALILFSREQKKFFKMWHICYSTNVNSDALEKFTAGVGAIVESYKSLNKILNLAKKPQKQESGKSQATDNASNKSLYNKVVTDLTHVVNLIEKSESLDSETLQMITSGVARIVALAQEKSAKKQVKKVA